MWQVDKEVKICQSKRTARRFCPLLAIVVVHDNNLNALHMASCGRQCCVCVRDSIVEKWNGRNSNFYLTIRLLPFCYTESPFIYFSWHINKNCWCHHSRASGMQADLFIWWLSWVQADGLGLRWPFGLGLDSVTECCKGVRANYDQTAGPHFERVNMESGSTQWVGLVRCTLYAFALTFNRFFLFFFCFLHSKLKTTKLIWVSF